MSFSQNREPAFLKPEEASAVEAAVRTAVRSILKVFWELNEKRAHCYEVKLAEAERENAELKFQLKTAEQELQTLRHISANYTISAERAFSPDAEEPGQDPDPASFQSVSVPDSAGVRVLKEEEPFYDSKVFIKSEMAEQGSVVNFNGHPVIENNQICPQAAQIQTYHTCSHSINQDPVLTGSERRRLTRYENVRRYRERIRADPVKYLAWKEKNRLRYLQNRKTINELPEPMKKLQRKAWREATRRHRAKKLAQATLPATSMSQTASL